MRGVEAARAIVDVFAHRVFRDLVERSSNEVAERVASEDISGEKHDVHYQDKASNPDPKSIREKERSYGVVDQESPDNVGEPQEVAMIVLQDEREASFAPIAFTRFAH
jgi:hypothetical protein